MPYHLGAGSLVGVGVGQEALLVEVAVVVVAVVALVEAGDAVLGTLLTEYLELAAGGFGVLAVLGAGYLQLAVAQRQTGGLDTGEQGAVAGHGSLGLVEYLGIDLHQTVVEHAVLVGYG